MEYTLNSEALYLDKDHSTDEHGRRRKRISQACDLCNKRKVRCDGNQPCATCLKANTECVYHRIDFRHCKGQSVKQLQSHVQRLERELLEERAKSAHFENLVRLISAERASVPGSNGQIFGSCAALQPLNSELLSDDRYAAAQALAALPKVSSSPQQAQAMFDNLREANEKAPSPTMYSMLQNIDSSSNLSGKDSANLEERSSVQLASSSLTSTDYAKPLTVQHKSPLVVNPPTLEFKNPRDAPVYWSHLENVRIDSARSLDNKVMPLIESSYSSVLKSHTLPNHLRGLEPLPKEVGDPLSYVLRLYLLESGFPSGVSNALLQQVLISFLKGPYRFLLRPLPDHIMVKHFARFSPVLRYSVYAVMLGVYSEELRFTRKRVKGTLQYNDARRLSVEFAELVKKELTKLSENWTFSEILGMLVWVMYTEYTGLRKDSLQHLKTMIQKLLLARMNDENANFEAARELINSTGPERELGFYMNEARRRLFWMIYVADRFFSGANQQSCMIKAADVRVGFPRSFQSNVVTHMLPLEPMIAGSLECDADKLLEKVALQVVSLNKLQSPESYDNPYAEPINYLAFHLLESEIRQLKPGVSAQELREHAIKLILTAGSDFLPAIPDLINPIAHFIFVILEKLRIFKLGSQIIYLNLAKLPVNFVNMPPCNDLGLYVEYEQRMLKLEASMLSWFKHFYSNPHSWPTSNDGASDREAKGSVALCDALISYFGNTIILNKLRAMMADRKSQYLEGEDYKSQPLVSFNINRLSNSNSDDGDLAAKGEDVLQGLDDQKEYANPEADAKPSRKDARRGNIKKGSKCLLLIGLNLSVTPEMVCASIIVADLLYRRLKNKKYNYHASKLILFPIFHASSIHLGRSLLCLKAIRTILHASSIRFAAGKLSDREIEYIALKLRDWNALRMIIRGYLDVILIAMEHLKNSSRLHFEVFKLTLAMTQAVLNVEHEFFAQVRQEPLFLACIVKYCSKLCPRMANLFKFQSHQAEPENWSRFSVKFLNNLDICRRVLIERLPHTPAFQTLKNRPDYRLYAEFAESSEESKDSASIPHYIDPHVKQNHDGASMAKFLYKSTKNGPVFVDASGEQSSAVGEVDEQTMSDIEALEKHFSLFNTSYDTMSSLQETKLRSEAVGGHATPISKECGGVQEAPGSKRKFEESVDNAATELDKISVDDSGKPRRPVSTEAEASAKSATWFEDWRQRNTKAKVSHDDEDVENLYREQFGGRYFSQGDMNLFSEDFFAREFLTNSLSVEEDIFSKDHDHAYYDLKSQVEKTLEAEIPVNAGSSSTVFPSTSYLPLLTSNGTLKEPVLTLEALINGNSVSRSVDRSKGEKQQPLISSILSKTMNADVIEPTLSETSTLDDAANLSADIQDSAYSSLDLATLNMNLPQLSFFEGLWQTALGENSPLYELYDF